MKSAPLRFASPLTLLPLMLCSLPCPASEDPLPDAVPGVVHQQPTTGPFVRTPVGFMVPYAVTVPGTNVRFEMVPVPGGKHSIRNPHLNSDVEIELAPFWMGRYEVTWQEYRHYMRLYYPLKQVAAKRGNGLAPVDHVDAVSAPTPIYDLKGRLQFTHSLRQPAVSMTQYAARQYTKWLSMRLKQQYRLPTEAEWERACRAGRQSRWSFGDQRSDVDAHAVCAINSGDNGPAVVGTKLPNRWGLYDMHGNVAEWVVEQFQADGDTGPGAGEKSVQEAVGGSQSSYERVVRGGSWLDSPDDCQSDSRRSSSVDWWMYDAGLPKSPWWLAFDDSVAIGFRIVRSLEPLPRTEIEKYWQPDTEELEFDVSDRIADGRGAMGLIDESLLQSIESAPVPADDISVWLQRRKSHER